MRRRSSATSVWSTNFAVFRTSKGFLEFDEAMEGSLPLQRSNEDSDVDFFVKYRTLTGLCMGPVEPVRE